MGRDWQDGNWLLLDAAGPDLVLGILLDGCWLQFDRREDGVIESLQDGVGKILTSAGLNLASLKGVLFATGPGSTLGLRLAAMFVRTLLQLPDLCHWRCLTYNNLELACAAQLDPENPMPYQLGAPWRKDRLHRATFNPVNPKRFDLDSVDPVDSPPATLPIVALGNRAKTHSANPKALPYPSDRVPGILSDWPDLLTETEQPDLYSVHAPEFKRWAPSRHPQK